LRLGAILKGATSKKPNFFIHYLIYICGISKLSFLLGAFILIKALTWVNLLLTTTIAAPLRCKNIFALRKRCGKKNLKLLQSTCSRKLTRSAVSFCSQRVQDSNLLYYALNITLYLLKHVYLFRLTKTKL